MAWISRAEVVGLVNGHAGVSSGLHESLPGTLDIRAAQHTGVTRKSRHVSYRIIFV